MYARSYRGARPGRLSLREGTIIFFVMSLRKEERLEGREVRTCVFMGNPTGTVECAATGGQIVDDITLVKGSPHS